MSTRCLACNKQLNDIELLGKKLDGTCEDMCVICRAKAREQYNWLRDYEHCFEHLTDEYKCYLHKRIDNPLRDYYNE